MQQVFLFENAAYTRLICLMRRAGGQLQNEMYNYLDLTTLDYIIFETTTTKTEAA